MELRLTEYQTPKQILFNYEELKTGLEGKAKMYETLVYTEEQIKEAKADKASLNKLKKALNDERIRLEKEYMMPFNDFKLKINELIKIVDKPVSVIDKQVKEFEDKKKQDKYDAIKAMWEELEHPSELTLEKIYDSKWLNSTTSMKNIKDTMVAAVEKFNQDMTTLSNLPEFGFEATEVYKSTLDVNKAIYEAQRMSQIAKAKAEREAELERQRIEREEKARRAEEEARKIAVQEVKQEYQTPDIVEVEEPEQVIESTDNSVNEKTWVSFSALLTTEDAYALKDFFNSRNIEFKAI